MELEEALAKIKALEKSVATATAATTAAQEKATTLSATLGEKSSSVDALTASLEQLQTQAGTYQQNLVAVHQGTLLSGLIDPDLAGLAPKVELGTDGQPTAESVTAIHSWREGKAHFFKAPESPGAPTIPPATPPRTSTPPVDPGGNQFSWKYWGDMEKDDPHEFQKQQPAYIAWAIANEPK